MVDTRDGVVALDGALTVHANGGDIFLEAAGRFNMVWMVVQADPCLKAPAPGLMIHKHTKFDIDNGI